MVHFEIKVNPSTFLQLIIYQRVAVQIQEIGLLLGSLTIYITIK